MSVVIRADFIIATKVQLSSYAVTYKQPNIRCCAFSAKHNTGQRLSPCKCSVSEDDVTFRTLCIWCVLLCMPDQQMVWCLVSDRFAWAQITSMTPANYVNIGCIFWCYFCVFFWYFCASDVVVKSATLSMSCSTADCDDRLWFYGLVLSRFCYNLICSTPSV